MSGNNFDEEMDLSDYSAIVAIAHPNGWFYEVRGPDGTEITEESIHGQFASDQDQCDDREAAEEAAVRLMTEHWEQTNPINGETLRTRVTKRERTES